MKKKFHVSLLVSLITVMLLPLIAWNTQAETAPSYITQGSSPAEVQPAPSAPEEIVRAIVERVSTQLQEPDAPFIRLSRSNGDKKS